MRMAGKTAIVTGASSGIGRAIALRFAAEGANVVIADLTPSPREGGKPTEELASTSDGTAIFQRTDVCLWADIDAVVTETVERFGRLDVMVNNAAIALGRPLLATTEADWRQVMAVNLTGVFFGCKRAVQQMLGQEIVGEARGRIVNISSQHGMISAPEDFAYGVSKSGVVYMTRQIAADYAEQHIVCNAVAPGKVLTGKTGPATEPRWLEYSESRTPMPRLGKPEDIANAALFLASGEATFVTGINLLVDGGWMAS